MRNFTVSADTSCDIFRSTLDEMNVPWVPLSYMIEGNTYEDDFTTDGEYEAFYKKLKSGAMPTTSQINLFTHKEFFQSIVDKGNKNIIHLPLSSGLSATFDAATGAAKQVMDENEGVRIAVIDGLSATQGNAYLVQLLVKMRDEGVFLDSATEQIKQLADNLHHWIIVDDLMHLKRGGRVSGPSAYIGSLLQIKPVLVINDKGKLAVVKKCKGILNSYKYVLEMMAEHNIDTSMPVIIAQADSREMEKTMKEMIEEKYPSVKCQSGWVGPIIGAHTGSGMIGIIFKGDARLTNK